MTMRPNWIDDQVSAFGRQLELTTLALNARGMAAVQFENGLKLVLEYHAPELWVQVLMPLTANAETLTRLLGESTPRRGTTPAGTVRSAYLERSGEALLVVALPEDRITPPEIDATFRELFERAVKMGRQS